MALKWCPLKMSNQCARKRNDSPICDWEAWNGIEIAPQWKKNKRHLSLLERQCATSVKTYIEGDKDCETIEEQDDVIESMKLIESLSCRCIQNQDCYTRKPFCMWIFPIPQPPGKWPTFVSFLVPSWWRTHCTPFCMGNGNKTRNIIILMVNAKSCEGFLFEDISSIVAPKKIDGPTLGFWVFLPCWVLQCRVGCWKALAFYSWVAFHSVHYNHRSAPVFLLRIFLCNTVYNAHCMHQTLWYAY